METLVLDIGYQPHSRVSWKDAIIKILIDKTAEIIDEYPDRYINTVNWSIKMPSVVRLVVPVKRKKVVKFSRHGIYMRDGGRCQYCGHSVNKSDMQYEHVIPRAQGGKTCWEKIVVSCSSCNQRKGGRTPTQAKMHLLKDPIRPKVLPDTFGMSYHSDMPESWREWLRSAVYWDGSLDEE